MVIIILGPSHIGKTYLSSRLIEELKYPSFSIDHLKMGLIRSKYTHLTVNDTDDLTTLLWPIVSNMINTVIENEQNLIVEGCYVPFDFLATFDDKYLEHIKYVCLATSEEYIENNYDTIIKYASCIEKRIEDDYFTKQYMLKENAKYLKGYKENKLNYYLINDSFLETIQKIIKDIIKGKGE